MRYSGIQPQYFPRLHYFARILDADIFMIRDEAQFLRKHKYPDGKNGKSYQADTPIKFASGPQFLSVPVKHSAEGLLPIYKTEISYDFPWVEEQIATINLFYARAKNFSKTFPHIELILTQKYKYISELNIASILWGILFLLEKEITTKTLTLAYVNEVLKNQSTFRLKEIRLSSESKSIAKFNEMNANEKIVALIKEVEANEDYCGGTSVAAYVDHSLFKKNAITMVVQDWNCKEYPQLFMRQQGFIPNLSIVDLLCNVSPDEACSILS